MQISPTQSNVQAALRAFLLDVLPSYGPDGLPLEAIAAVANRVPEPRGTSFVVITPIRFSRLSTNIDDFEDVKFTASITTNTGSFSANIIAGQVQPVVSPSIMTVTVVDGLTALVPGATISGANIAAGTTILSQISGDPGGVGTYAIAPSQSAVSAACTISYGTMVVTEVDFGVLAVGAEVLGAADGTVILSGPSGGGVGTYLVSEGQTLASTTLAAGQRLMTQSAQVTVQIDFHSADSSASDNAQTVATALRDEFGVDFFQDLAAPLNGVTPLYADDPRYQPFLNDQQQSEWRWVLDANLQVKQTVAVSQAFADAATVTTKDVSALYPP